MEENLYSVHDVESEKFYKLPKDLFTLVRYANLSNDARVLYAMLKDRLDVSIKNNWVDEEGKVYFNFSRKSIEKILQVSKNTAIKRFNELKDVGLLIEKTVVEGKSLRLYLCRIVNDGKCINLESTEKTGAKFEPVQNLNRFKKSTPPVQNLNPNKTNIIRLNNIYSHFNSKNIIQHRKLNEQISKTIAKALKEYSEEEIIQAIDNYAKVLNSNYYYNHKWTLEKFLKQKNGLQEFLETGSVWINYKSSMNKSDGIRVNQPHIQEPRGRQEIKMILEEDM